MMLRISSSITLLLKIFLPTFWLVFFGTLCLAILISGEDLTPLFGNWTFKIGVVLFFTTGALVLYFTLMQLKRVELDREYLYVTNYFRTVRYSLQDIDRITETNLVILVLGHLYLKAPGRFGKKITFVESRQKFEDYIRSNPALMHLVQGD